MKDFKLTPLTIIIIILIILVVSICYKKYFGIEGLENMFNDKGQFSEFILPEYSRSSPLTQLTETIFYDKQNGNIVEAVVEWTSAGDIAREDASGAAADAGAADDDAAADAEAAAAEAAEAAKASGHQDLDA